MEPAVGKSCGTCSLCCKIVAVAEIDKPRDRWCVHARGSQGCAIYHERPRSCRDFSCLWLTEANLGPQFKPDRTKTVMLGVPDHGPLGQKAIFAICDVATPSAWRAEPMIGLLRAAAAHGHDVYAVAGSRFWRVRPDGENETAPVELVPRGHRPAATAS